MMAFIARRYVATSRRLRIERERTFCVIVGLGLLILTGFIKAKKHISHITTAIIQIDVR